MKEVLLDNIINSIKKYYDYDNNKLLEIRYGLESLYLSITKIIVILLISIVIKTTKELLLLFLFYGLLRLTGFGAHAKKSIHCYFTSIPLFVLVPYLIKTITINNYLLLIISVFSILLLSIYAPADTEKRPILKRRKIYKILTISISLIYLIIIIISNNTYIKNLLFFSILIETLLVLPITYKLLGVKYNNYKRYMRKEDKK